MWYNVGMKKKINKKIVGKKMTIDELTGIVKNSFTNFDESFETKLEEKLEEKLDSKLGGFRTEVNNKFFEVKDQLNLLQNKMERVETLFGKNDVEHKVFHTRIDRLEKA